MATRWLVALTTVNGYEMFWVLTHWPNILVFGGCLQRQKRKSSYRKTWTKGVACDGVTCLEQFFFGCFCRKSKIICYVFSSFSRQVCYVNFFLDNILMTHFIILSSFCTLNGPVCRRPDSLKLWSWSFWPWCRKLKVSEILKEKVLQWADVEITYAAFVKVI